MVSPTAFVIMPIGENGTEDAKAFETLYHTFLERPLKELGYAVTRADKVPKSGSIFKDIIRRLIEADLVVADLTSLNPNVMLELGIRYAAKKSGTILICDRAKTPTLPFDLKDYRTIFYDDTREAGAKLLAGLKEFASDASMRAPEDTDSPVYHHYSGGPTAWVRGELEAKIAELHHIIEQGAPADRQPATPDSDKPAMSPSEILAKAQAEIEEGNVPWLLLDRASRAASARDIGDFLKCIDAIMALRAITLSDREYIDIYYLAGNLDLRNVLPAILEMGLAVYPDSEMLNRSRMSYLAHSVHFNERQEAKDLISEKLKIDPVKGTIDSDKIRYAGGDLSLLSIFLDAIHKDREDDLALKITTKLYDQFPRNTVVLRNYARAVERVKGSGAAYDFYMKAVQDCDDVDTTSAHWLAVELWTRGDFKRAIEICIVACMLDLDDAGSFGRLARYVSELLQPKNIVHDSLLDGSTYGLSFETLAELIVYGHSCPHVSLEDRGSFEAAMRNADVTTEDINRQTDRLGALSRRERAMYVKALYKTFASPLSEGIFRRESGADAPSMSAC